ncbi:MAG: ABC transporter substrate-binding protein [Firmicutes bacterium]|jgi:branched-chain amino acid transport system substrate-binding protein|nr:ABC transporter substrate-binding protein [Bacillota bacterium]
MIMTKKILSLLSVLLLLAILVSSGCGGNDQASGPDPGPAQEGEETPESTVVKVGMVGPLSGGAATYGQSVRNGVEIAVNEVNENNEIEGVVLELLAEDSEGDWSKAANAFSKLAEQDKVNVIVGGVLSSESEAGGPIIMSAQIPTISPSSTATGLTVGNPYLFRNCLSDEVQASQLAEYAVTELGLSKFAILYTNNDYGVALKNAFEETAGSLAEVLAVEAFMDNDENFKPQLTNIQQQNPEAIFIAGYYTEAAKIAQQAKEQGLEVQLLGADGFYSPVLVEIGADAVEGAIFTAGFHSGDESPAVQNFVTKYRELFNEEPDMFAAQAYDAARIVIEAIKTKGTTPEQIREGIAETENFPGITGNTSIDEEGDTIKDVLILKVEGGAFDRIR